MVLCSAAAMSPVCRKWNICAGLILMKTSWQYASSPLWDWALVTLLVWDFISCLSGTYYTLKMYSKHVSTGDFIASACSSLQHHTAIILNSCSREATFICHVESNSGQREIKHFSIVLFTNIVNNSIIVKQSSVKKTFYQIYWVLNIVLWIIYSKLECMPANNTTVIPTYEWYLWL